jgi:CheY-like chemotaxis protein
MNATPKISDRRWLVVDDNPDVAHLLGMVLKALGLADVEEFTSAENALARTQFADFDVLVTDRDMPGIDGLELARQVHARAPQTKILLVSAHIDDLSADELTRSGISAALAKPFTLSRLEAVLRSLACEPAEVDAAFDSSAICRAA